MIKIEEGGLSLVIDPAIGAGVRRLDLIGPLAKHAVQRGAQPTSQDQTGVAFWRPTSGAASHFNDLACYVMLPWCNRIDGGTFDFEGIPRRVKINWPDGTAIHGDTMHRPWRILDRSPLSARLGFDSSDHADFNWPWPIEATVRYEIESLGDSATAVHLALSVTNRGDTAMPAGGGWHPYFRREIAPGDRVALQADVTGRYPCERVMPVGLAAMDETARWLATGGELGLRSMDDVFAGFGGNASVRYDRAGLTARWRCSGELSHAVIFSPIDDVRGRRTAKDFFCFEPVTMVNNGLNLLAQGWSGTGVLRLAPGETMSASWTMTVTAEA